MINHTYDSVKPIVNEFINMSIVVKLNHHELVPSMYGCFYYILIIYLTFSVKLSLT